MMQLAASLCTLCRFFYDKSSLPLVIVFTITCTHPTEVHHHEVTQVPDKPFKAIVESSECYTDRVP